MNKRTFSLTYLALVAMALIIAISHQTTRSNSAPHPALSSSTGFTIVNTQPSQDSYLSGYYNSLQLLLNEYQAFGPFS
ncbi:MAG: hypothetical protein MI976_21085 [Pseudomonadales bacterium]|nr:hypothetical protein [Pseudomonadales bacterium]